MDFVRLVEDGTYDTKEISGEYDKGVLRGYEMAMQDVLTLPHKRQVESASVRAA